MKEDLKEIKKAIVKEWLNGFPQLTSLTQTKLYKVLGPVIIGIELIGLPRTEEYRPYFVIYLLTGNDLNASLDSPILLQEYYDKKSFQYDIPYQKHGFYFPDVVRSVKEQTPFSFDGEVSMQELFAAIDNCSKVQHERADSKTYLYAALQEAKLEIAIYKSSTQEINRILEKIKKCNWDLNHFKAWGVDVSIWLYDQQLKADQPQRILDQVEANKQHKKLKHLKYSELI